MMTIKTYDPAMQPAVETCFKSCVAALGWEYQPSGRHADIVNIGGVYMKHGCFWCLFEDETLIGMVAARCLDEQSGVAEIKRLYVLPEYQGRGYGGLLFGHALDYVKAQGYKTVRADTRRDRAASLYLLGKYRFRQVEKYNENAFAELYFELDLAAQPVTPWAP